MTVYQAMKNKYGRIKNGIVCNYHLHLATQAKNLSCNRMIILSGIMS